MTQHNKSANGGIFNCDEPLSLSMCPSVLPSPFFPLVSTGSLVHAECHKASKSIKEIKLESMGVKRVSQWCFWVFLAATSSSKSDDVTKLVCVCVYSQSV